MRSTQLAYNFLTDSAVSSFFPLARVCACMQVCCWSTKHLIKYWFFEWRQINYANWVSFSDTTQDWNGQKRRHVWATTGDGSAPCSADVTHWSANSSLSWICTSNIRTALWTTLWLSTAAPPRVPRSRLSSI
jgi:hypothetical protein